MGFYRCPYIIQTGKVCNEGCYRPEGCRVHWNPTRVPCKECGKLTSSIFGACRTHAGSIDFKIIISGKSLRKWRKTVLG